MIILAIETSCDETAVALIEARGDFASHRFSILGNALLSQAEKHAEFGGVYPTLAKREHAKNLVPLLEQALGEAQFLTEEKQVLSNDTRLELQDILSREPELYEALVVLVSRIARPNIDAIAVTEGPGLAPALWVGVNFAKALSLLWNIPILPINHMEGHILASIMSEEHELGRVEFPALALLISGGHTELVLVKDWLSYELIGSTRDDAVGEAFDKVARMLELGYPGGPEVSKMAKFARDNGNDLTYTLPRPMLHTDDCDFSFSGIKTAVLYSLKEIETITPEIKQAFAREFEDAVVEILLKKTRKAIDETGAKTLILGGGVSANTSIRKAFTELFENEYPDHLLYIPDPSLSTDNAIMIGIAGFMRALKEHYGTPQAQGNLKLHT